MKIYTGIRDGDDCFVRVRADTGGEPYLLPGRPDLFRDCLPDLPPPAAGQAPPTFHWAEPGPGTDHLAVAIAVDVATGAASADEAATLLAGLPFLRRFLSHLPPDGFEISQTIFAALLKAAIPASPGAAAAPRTRRWLQAVSS